MAGKDATSLFKALHPTGILEEYTIDPPSLIDGSADDSEEGGKPRFVGLVDRDTIVALPMDEGREEGGRERTPLAQIIGLPDFEVSCARLGRVARTAERLDALMVMGHEVGLQACRRPLRCLARLVLW